MAERSSTRVRKRSRKSHRRNEPRLPPTNFSKLWIWALVLFVSAQQVFSAGLLRQEFNGANSTGDGSRMAAARFRRETIKLDNAITNLGYLARIANGIALEIGLVDGTIDPGEAVAELLHMGSLKVDDVINLNQENIDNVLNALGDKTSAEDAVIKAEDWLDNLEELREMAPKFGDLEKIPGLEKFKEAFEKVKVLVGSKTDLDKLTERVDEIHGALMKLEKAVKETLDQQVIDESEPRMKSVAVIMKSVKSSENLFNSLTNNVMEARKILDESNLMKTLQEEAKLRKNLNIDYKKGFDKLTKNFEKVNDASKKASTAEKDFESIQKLSDSRKHSHRQLFKVSSGFPEGPADLRKLYSESVDPRVVKQISDGETVTESLKQGFESFKKLEESLADVSFKWKSLANSPSEFEKALNRAFQLASLSKSYVTASEVVNNLKLCEGDIKTPPSHDTTELKELDTKMSLLTKISDFSHINELRKTPMTDFDVDEGKTSDERKAFVEALLGKWNKDEKLKKFVANVNSLHEDLSHLKKLVDYVSRNSDLKSLTKYFDATFKDQKYEQFLTCLRNITADGYPVKELIEYLRDSRKSSSYSVVISTIHEVIESGKSLKTAETAAESFSKNTALPPQVALLKSSFDKDGYKETSEKLGMGVQGLIAIKRVREAKLETLLKDVNDILKDAGEKGLSPEQQSSLKQLKEIPKVVTSIDNFMKSSTGLQAFRRRRDTGFKDFHQIFMDAQAIQGVSIDMKSLRDAMEKLDKVTNQKHATSMVELKNLEALDLDFSKFNFKDVPTSLNALDVFFFNYALQLSESPSSSGQQDPSFDGLVETTTAGGDGTSLVIIIGGSLLFLVVIALIIWLIRTFLCKPKPPPPTPTPIPDDESDSNSHEKEDKKGGKDPNGGKKDDDDGGSKENKGKKSEDPKPPPSAGGPGPTPPPPPPPPTDQGNAPPPGTSNDQAGAPSVHSELPSGDPKREAPSAPSLPEQLISETRTKKLVHKEPELPVSNEESLALVKTSAAQIREAAKEGISPKGWAKAICEQPLGVYERMTSEEREAMRFVAQGPFDETEEGRRETCGKHHAMIHKYKITSIIQLCQNEEEEDKMAGKVEKVKKSGEYYYDYEGGRGAYNNGYWMKTKKIIDGPIRFTDKKNFTLFNLQSITCDELLNEIKRDLDLLLYKGWPDHSVPKTTDATLEILDFAEGPLNLLITSHTGTGRAGTLASIIYGIDMCQRMVVNDPKEFIKKVREIRYGAVREDVQLTFLILCITKSIMKERGIEFCKELHEMEWYHRRCLEEKNAGGYEHTAELLLEDQAKMDAHVQQLEEEYLRKKHIEDERQKAEDAKNAEENEKVKAESEDNREENNKSNDTKSTTKQKSDGKKPSTSSDVKKDSEGEEKNSKASSVSSGSKNKSKKSEKNSKASVASGGSQKKSKKSQKDSKKKAKTTAVPSGSQEKLKKKSTNGEEKKSEEKKKPSVVQKQEKKRSKSKPTKKGGAKA
ncbi:hypothetical protein CAEBREN_20794 [Caenorhabditis brenneri]|uniref:Tyrosine-protein phosphatase domain-containing protein n=1 Tax=Caenorhabditis brenneri TaxID=135651 RepID=G0N3D1_CAEBE|nr:hypothetical protein CAEBREN_20794 [Caenorhabditis brenneri]